jgi:hypothetical protein
MSEGDPEGGSGWGLASKAFGAESKSLFKVPACDDENCEVFPGGAGGDDKLKLSSVGVAPK